MKTDSSCEHQPARTLLRDERGVALPLALVVILILTALTAGLAEMTVAEIEMQGRALRDTTATYLALAGLEHQVYLLKADKDAGAVAAFNYPVTAGAEYWYSTTLLCLLQCSSNRESRRWEIVATGEVRKSGTGTILQTRAIRAVVEIAYAGSAPTLYQFPSKVTMLRWEEVYP
jgi:Tfp pilus assembly protein PilX